MIDTAGTGFHLTSTANGVHFDMKGNGRSIQIAWTAPESRNGWLALPQDGHVTSGKELFGNFTPQPSSTHPNGFLALALYDKPENGGNGDGVIDSLDAVWNKLRVWIDTKHDGIAQPNELHTLPSVGVYSIALAYNETKFTDQFGNQFRYKGNVNPKGQANYDHVDRTIYDVFLGADSSANMKSTPSKNQTINGDLVADHQLK